MLVHRALIYSEGIDSEMNTVKSFFLANGYQELIVKISIESLLDCKKVASLFTSSMHWDIL